MNFINIKMHSTTIKIMSSVCCYNIVCCIVALAYMKFQRRFYFQPSYLFLLWRWFVEDVGWISLQLIILCLKVIYVKWLCFKLSMCHFFSECILKLRGEDSVASDSGSHASATTNTSRDSRRKGNKRYVSWKDHWCMHSAEGLDADPTVTSYSWAACHGK